MIFTRDVELGLEAAVDLVNTLPGTTADSPDGLTAMAELDDWFDRERFTGERRRDASELASMRALRARLRSLWEAGSDAEAAGLVNAMLADGRAMPQVVEHDEMGWHVHATRADAPLADRVMVEIAMDWVDVLRQGERARMKVCAADDCEAVLVDFSRNRSKRFCDTGNCGNRMNVRAFRARHADA